MIFPAASNAAETIENANGNSIANSFVFDYTTNTFRMIDGSPVLITGIDAVSQWLELFVRTIPKKYAIYGEEDFGVDATKLIGKKSIPSGAIISEIKREIEDGVLLCPAIQSVYDFDLSGSTISFTVSLHDGEERELSIEI